MFTEISHSIFNHMVVTETSRQCSGCCKGPEGWAAVKEKQMMLGGLYNAGGSEVCHRVHLAPRPGGARLLVGGRNWLRLKLRGTENEVALTQQRVVICCWLPQGPPAEVDHDPPEQLLCSPHSSTSGLVSTEDHTRSVQPRHTEIKQESHPQIGLFLKGLCIRLRHTFFIFSLPVRAFSDLIRIYGGGCLSETSSSSIWLNQNECDLLPVTFGLVQKQLNVNQPGSFRKYCVTAKIQTALLVF